MPAKKAIKYLTRNFHISEFACKDGTPVPEKLIPNVQKLAEQLQILRDEIAEPIHIISGYRTVKHNKAVGGARYSQHLKAKAADIMCKNTPPDEVQALIEGLILTGKMKNGGIGKYSTFTHYDVRGRKARW